MGRPKRGDRALGPYRHGRGWLVRYVVAGELESQTYASRAEAEREARDYNRRVEAQDRTVSASLDRYEAMMASRGDKPRSVANVLHALRPLLEPVLTLSVASVSPKRARELYDSYRQTTTRLGRPPEAATHRHSLKLAQALGAWWVEIGWTRANPFARVVPVGKPRRGKEQLRANEARTLSDVCRAAAEQGDASALPPLIALYLGLRSGEIVGLRARDIDDGGRLLWVPRDATKTDAGERRLVLEPAWLGELLVAHAARRAPWRLFPHGSTWVTKQVTRWCATASVPRVTAHGLRGTHATLAEQHGATAAAVAASLGHTGTETAAQHYTAPGVRQDAERRRALQVLEGGKR